jgi:hypothetical protein
VATRIGRGRPNAGGSSEFQSRKGFAPLVSAFKVLSSINDRVDEGGRIDKGGCIYKTIVSTKAFIRQRRVYR